jgi:two-component system sensor histidine kinase KdpD
MHRFGLTVLACIGTTLVATPMLGHLDLRNIVMLFLLTVLIVAVNLGRGAAILASILSVLFSTSSSSRHASPSLSATFSTW